MPYKYAIFKNFRQQENKKIYIYNIMGLLRMIL